MVGVGFKLGASERSAQTNGFPLDAFTRAGRTTPLRPTASHMGVVNAGLVPLSLPLPPPNPGLVPLFQTPSHFLPSPVHFIPTTAFTTTVSQSPSTLQIVHAKAGCRSVFRRQPDRAKSAPPPDSVTLTRPVVALSPSVSSCDSVISHARTVNKEDITESPNPPDARTTIKSQHAFLAGILAPDHGPLCTSPCHNPPKHPTQPTIRLSPPQSNPPKKKKKKRKRTQPN